MPNLPSLQLLKLMHAAKENAASEAGAERQHVLLEQLMEHKEVEAA